MTLPEPAKRPESIRLFGRTYSINYTTMDELDGLCGLCDNIQQLIHVATDTGTEEFKDSVLHEVLHALCWVVKLGLKRDMEERIVTALAGALVGTFQDNPEFAQWLSQPKA